ncbi:MAG: lipoprotein [Halioglobus sp.]|nr:lipoprotein [Halioglobus sp.]
MLVVLTIVALSGCGQTGALYMPSEEAPRPPAAPADTEVPNNSVP